MKKILFVCLGNICRSPAADGYLVHLIEKRGLQEQILVDSAGTNGHHNGARADDRMRAHALKRGYKLDSLSRVFKLDDFKDFDLIIVMDKSNYRNISLLDTKGEYLNKVKMFCDFCTEHSETEVPDPYFGGEEGFETVLDIVEDGIEGILKLYGQ